MKETFKAWVAGFVDGEGCIGIAKNKAVKGGLEFYYLRLCVTQNTKLELIMLQKIYGGSVSPHGDGWQWIISAKKSLKPLKDILPYLRIKRKEAKLALEFQAQKRHGSIRDKEYLKEQEKYYWAMRGLKTRR